MATHLIIRQNVYYIIDIPLYTSVWGMMVSVIYFWVILWSVGCILVLCFYKRSYLRDNIALIQ